MKDRVILIGGTFDNEIGKPSKIIDSMAAEIKPDFLVNGGNFNEIEDITYLIQSYSVVYWFPSIRNNKRKYLPDIKVRNPICTLITSKRNHNNSYSIHEILNRAIEVKSNLVLELIEGSRLQGRILDPLGNQYAVSDDFVELARQLKIRVDFIRGGIRSQSRQFGPAKEIPNEEEFFEVVRTHSETFHSLIQNGCNTRFMGNCSFRCESGFPSFRDKDLVYVTRRNIDKRDIGVQSFVAVNPWLLVGYYGEHKPSIDTPIQVGLYGVFKNARYMLHCHVYVDGAPFTKHCIPCGDYREVMEVFAALGCNSKLVNVSVNLRGHGSIIISDNPRYIRNRKFVHRVIPEIQDDQKV